MRISKKSLISVSLAVLITCGLVTAVAVKTHSNPKKTSTEAVATSNVQQISLQGDLQENFDSVVKLKQRAAAIVEVDVTSSETIVYKDMPFTISTAKVLSKIKGIIKEGQEIKLIETGGKFKLTGENPKEAKGQEAEVSFEGIRVMQPGDHLFLFLDKFVGPQVTDAYIPLGVYQGKFKVESNKVYQQAPNDNKLSDYKQPVDKEVFKEKLK